MPEYLAPGVFVEETSFRQKTIEGVSTSTTAFVGPTRFGPESDEPPLLTSFSEFERIYGGLDQLSFDTEEATHNYLAHAVRAYFEEGGRRLYVARVVDDAAQRARAEVADSPSIIDFEARHPGVAGNFSLTLIFKAGENILGLAPRDPSQPLSTDTVPILRGVRAGDIVLGTETGSPAGELELYHVEDFVDGGRSTFRLAPAEPSSPDEAMALDSFSFVRALAVSVISGALGRFSDQQSWEDLNFRGEHSESFFTVFQPAPANRRAQLYVPLVVNVDPNSRVDAVADLLALESLANAPASSPSLTILAGLNDDESTDAQRSARIFLTAGTDGPRLGSADYEGDDDHPKTGLKTLEDLEGISIIAAPGSTHSDGEDTGADVRRLLISHCERMRYRVAVLDSVNNQLISEVRADRSSIDTTRAGLYYPWISIADPITETDIYLPPSGFVSGIFARNDIERGVHKAPANEVLRLAKGLEISINKSQQEVLNPDGINVIRFFEGRGYRIWGARTATSDAEWKYMNVRRYFAFLERSIELGTQFAVFENNGLTLWANVRSTIQDFLFNEWKQDHLAGATPDQAYFVRCDRSTMTQNNIDNGQMICFIGVAPLRPAEFVIFRIGQKTVDSIQ
ncbi:MAG: phage tail sheath protein FI [Lentisphaeria bacterium]|jgi:phage tail sheath protein FI